MTNSLLLLVFSALTGCGGRCAAECEAVDRAYIAEHAACGVQIDAAPVCDAKNLETRLCQQRCLEETECGVIQGDTVFIDYDSSFQSWFECNMACTER